MRADGARRETDDPGAFINVVGQEVLAVRRIAGVNPNHVVVGHRGGGPGGGGRSGGIASRRTVGAGCCCATKVFDELPQPASNVDRASRVKAFLTLAPFAGLPLPTLRNRRPVGASDWHGSARFMGCGNRPPHRRKPSFQGLLLGEPLICGMVPRSADIPNETQIRVIFRRRSDQNTRKSLSSAPLDFPLPHPLQPTLLLRLTYCEG